MPATQNQIDFIKDICETLDIKCKYDNFTIQDASKFIDENLDDYYQRKEEMKRG